jgi:mannose-1-phosphate guanylyltransferase
MYVVVLAGGGGTRLWPLSATDRPKPFLPLLGERSLLQLTVDRLSGLVAVEDVVVVADRRHAALVDAQMPEIAVLPEPLGRNTAAAIALATAAIERPEDEVMVVLPADHWIADDVAFRDAIRAAALIAEGALGIEAPLVTLGVAPQRPATEYGYLIPRLETNEAGPSGQGYVLEAFEEKPIAERARQLLAVNGAAWNAGIFVWRRSAIRSAIERYTSLMTVLDPAVGSEIGLEMAYDRIVPRSIDVAVMESAARDRRVAMTTLDAGWSDLGSWTALLAALPGHRARRAIARVVPPGQVVDLRGVDLALRRRDGELELLDGPRTGLHSGTPMALFTDARSDLPALRALIDRVERAAVKQPESGPAAAEPVRAGR